MMSDSNDINPFATTSSLLVAGHEQAYAQVSPHLADPARLGAIGFLGRERSGKSTLLRHFQATAQPNLVMIYVGLDANSVHDEATLLRMLAVSSLEETVRQGYLPSASLGIVEPENFEDYRVWMRDEWLPQIYRAIRKHRRLVWLIDDAQYIIDALENKQIRSGIFDFLRYLLNPQLAAVLTLDRQYEDKIHHFSPFVESGNFHRLVKLSTADTARVLERYLVMTKDAQSLIFQNTDGEPYLIQQVAKLLYSRYGTQQIDVSAIRAIIPDVLMACNEEFERRWNILSQNEQQVLVAIANLHYERPLERIDPAAVETWLVETDYPMDRTAIAAAMRSLDYAELIRHTEGSAQVVALLLQRWLMNQDHTLPTTQVGQNLPTVISTNRRLLIAGMVLLAAIALLLALSLINDSGSDISPLPTVTLVND